MRPRGRAFSGLSLFELLLVCCIIFILIGVFGAYADTSVRIARERALQNELVNIRMALMHYAVVNGHLPAALSDLTKKELTGPDGQGKIIWKAYLDSYRLDPQGLMLDPFYNPYSYDGSTGKVNSSTKGFTAW